MEELKPCPRCNNSVSLDVFSIEPGWWVASIFCNGINDETCSIQFTAGADTKEEVIEGITRDWNTRYESTCHNVSNYKPKQGTFDVGGVFRCSECGFPYRYSELPYTYCPECGSKVV